MTDEKIIELLFARDERALAEIEKKYSKLCKFTAGNFLNSREDVEECVNEVLLAIWNHVPPEKPECLPAYLTVLARNAARTRSRGNNAWKRGANVTLVGEEFLSMLEDEFDVTAAFESHKAGEVINSFLDRLSKNERRVFMMRYWLDAGIEQIAESTGYSHSKIKSMLKRLRDRLAQALKKEGIIV